MSPTPVGIPKAFGTAEIVTVVLAHRREPEGIKFKLKLFYIIGELNGN
tara:strand:- start:1363 stop:1506 length:144 start_codon:yes stop_codon:yes gene_type:complete